MFKVTGLLKYMVVNSLGFDMATRFLMVTFLMPRFRCIYSKMDVRRLFIFQCMELTKQTDIYSTEAAIVDFDVFVFERNLSYALQPHTKMEVSNSYFSSYTHNIVKKIDGRIFPIPPLCFEMGNNKFYTPFIKTEMLIHFTATRLLLTCEVLTMWDLKLHTSNTPTLVPNTQYISSFKANPAAFNSQQWKEEIWGVWYAIKWLLQTFI